MYISKSYFLSLLALLPAPAQADSSSPSSYADSELKWHWRNYGSAKALSPVGRHVTIDVPSDTDIWRPAKSLDNFTAPFLYTTIAADKFKSVQVTVTAPWKTLYDQGGLVVAFPTSEVNASRFIKAGIEFTDGAAALGVVGTDILSDWSLSPIVEKQTGNAHATILIERQKTDAWVYVLESIGNQQRKRALRQVTWAFNKDDVQGLADKIQVGIYGAKPTEEKDPKQGIKVEFSDFELKLAGY